MDKKEIKTPQGNTAYIRYCFEGIPTDGLIPLFLGYTIKQDIIIQPHLIDDVGLLLHELTHVDQWYNYFLFETRYKYSRSFRFEMESEAFAAQLYGNKNMNKLEQYSNELSTRYNIKKNKAECKKNIQKYYKEQKND